MRTEKFLKQLKKELPRWVEKGWVSDDGKNAIIDDVASRTDSGSRYLTLALSILGVLLLGSGIITFFAANWKEMSKFTKLIVLFGGMWAVYAAAWYVLKKDHAPHAGQALLLLGVILFGANIMLVAQIYHIDEHYPNGVLIWSLGGILTAWLMRSHSAMALSIALGILWTSMEAFGFDRTFHWPFLILISACLTLVIIEQWFQAFKLAFTGIMLWCVFSFSAMNGYQSGWPPGSSLYLIQLYFVLYLALFIAGMILEEKELILPMTGIVKQYSAFASLLTFHVLTYPQIAEDYLRHGESGKPDIVLWGVLTVAALSVAGLLAIWHRRLTGGAARFAYLKWGEVLLYGTIALILFNLFSGAGQAETVAIFFNILFFSGTVWLVYAAMHSADKPLVNTAFFFFAITLLARYFDTFWTLMNRSYFFMTGGVLLLGGGYLIERQRRKITSDIKARLDKGVSQ